MGYEPMSEQVDLVSEEFVRGFARRFLDAWNSHEPDRLLALTTDDVLWEDPFIAAGSLRGHGALRAWLQSIWRAFPDLEFSLLEGASEDLLEGLYLARDKTRVVAPWRGRATMSGPLIPPGFAPTGSRAELVGVDLWEFRAGLLCHVRTITDTGTVARQIGALPAPGSSGERIGVIVQRLSARRMRRSAR